MVKISQKAFGKYIRSKREALNITREELAIKLSVTEDAVAKWENGKRYPDFETIANLAEALDIQVQDIFDNSVDRGEHRVALLNAAKIGVSILLAGSVVLGCVLGFIHNSRKENNEVLYASDIDYMALYSGEPDDRIEFISDFSAYKDNDNLRVLISFFDRDKAYPEIYNQEFEGMTITDMLTLQEQWEDHTQEDLSKLYMDSLDKVSSEMDAKDIEWLESLGASDIDDTKIGFLMCTLKKKKIGQLAEYGGKIRVSMAMQEAPVGIEQILPALYGTYRVDELLFTSFASSTIWTDENLEPYRKNLLTFAEDKYGFGDKLVDNPQYSIVYNSVIQNCLGAEDFEIKYMPAELVEFFSNGYYTVSLKGYGAGLHTIYCNGNQAYIDMGITIGIFRLVKEHGEEEDDKGENETNINKQLFDLLFSEEGEYAELNHSSFVYDGIIYEGLRKDISKSGKLIYERAPEREEFEDYLDERGYRVVKYNGKKMENIVPLEDGECSFENIDLAYVYVHKTKEYATIEYRDIDGHIYRINGQRTPGDIEGLKHILEYRQAEIAYTGNELLNKNTDIYEGKTAKESFDELVKCIVMKVEDLPEYYEPFLVAKLSETKYIEISQLVDGGHEDIQLALIKLCDGENIEYYKVLGRVF